MTSCTEEIPDLPRTNQKPKTFLWLYPDSTVGTGVSRQHLRWWGEDPDGRVIGYLFAFASFTNEVKTVPSPDTLAYTYVTTNDTLLAFPLDTLFRKYTVFVRGVDNSFRGLPHRSAVRLGTGPYWDKNRNGVFDGNDEPLDDLLNAIDPTGAVQTFPIRNTPPTIVFAQSPNDPSLALKQPDTTYPVATFGWKASDADGDNTLASYRVALNDTSDPTAWLTIPVRDTVVTLVVPRRRSDSASTIVAADVYGGKFLGRQLLGTVRGMRLDALNQLYLQARDVAGEYSRAITMPSGANHWYVKKPSASLLLVNDYILTGFDNPVPTYVTTLMNIPGGRFSTVDFLDIGRGLTNNDKSLGKPGALVPQYVDPALIYTFLLYEYVLWYTDRFPSLGVAQLSLFTYLQNGGKVVFSTTFLNSTDPRGALKDFAPIDSVSSENLLSPPIPSRGSNIIPASYRVIPNTSVPSNIYPQLALNEQPAIHSIFMRPVYRRSDARYIYHLQADTASTPARYIGMPNVGVVDGQGRIIFIGLPLHLLNNTVQGNPFGLTAFFTKVFTEGFNTSQSIDRSRF